MAMTKAKAKADVDRLCANTIRVLAMDAVQHANSGHPGMPMGAAAMAYVLWTRFLKHNPKNPAWPDRDRFVLSAGHGSMLLYALLYLTGYDLPLQEIQRFRQWGSRTPGHPEAGLTPGVETTTGPLGQGVATGVGMAMAERYLATYFNRPGHTLVDHSTYGIVSDGDLMEGVASEAASLAGHLGLGKLVYLYDQNHISLAGSTDLTFTEDVGRRFEAYGWQVQRVEDGNDADAIEAALEEARAEAERPSLIMVRTHIGYGSPHRQDTYLAHGQPLGAEEVKLTKQTLGWPTEVPFYVPQEALDQFRKAIDRGRKLEREWEQRLQAYQKAHPALADAWQAAMERKLPEGWASELPQWRPEQGPMATRSASGAALNALASHLPTLVGGSADLDPSTDTALKGCGDFENPAFRPEDRQGSAGGPWGHVGRSLHFGVREHAMGGILNGLARHGGLIPYGGTFLVFSDYMRPSIRLAALMEAPVTYVFTHDSIALGEDGPTHQPVEHLMALRAIPNLTVIRPSDANETVAAWRLAVQNRRGPIALVLSRQKLPILDRTKLPPATELERGAYILADPPEGEPEIILMATGSEVSLALEAGHRLVQRGVKARVVSMPSWELFDRQPQGYRDRVLPPHTKTRLAAEAGATLGWWKYVGAEGAVVGIDRFGTSAPGEVNMEKFGFTAEAIVEKALGLLRRAGPNNL